VEFRSEFTLLTDPGEAYCLLLDLERVAPCLPGAKIGEASGDGSYPATITVKLGPIRLRYQGALRIAERDDAARRAVLAGEAREARGQGGAKATMTMSVASAGEGPGARVDVITELQLSGRAAQMGRGVVEDVAGRLVSEMASCLEARFGTEGPAAAAAPTSTPEALPAGTLFLSALWGRLRRLLGR